MTITSAWIQDKENIIVNILTVLDEEKKVAIGWKQIDDENKMTY